jgi:ABC-type multidrug transport system ATPase subunit
MVAILGPSGSGKTSLLNVLSQRESLSGGSKTLGELKLNGQVMQKGDFGKMGAFVQQDDILIGVMTPYELFEFAYKIRSGKEGTEVHERVEKVLDKLGLQLCKNTRIGGWLERGISGGERRRASIGYEIITNPALLLLDEPTSGLDASTALRIIKILKQEATRGVSILATIHQPSSSILFCFDRVILLSEGYTIYNGPP